MLKSHIGAVVRATGVSAENIRYYEKQGLLPSAERADNRYRLYSEADIHQLRFIRQCRALDMSLDEVRGLLALNWDHPADCVSARRLLDEHLAHVQARLSELRQLKRELQALRDHCDGQSSRCQLLEALHARANQPPPAPSKGRRPRHV